jgi:murein DD-endopeptidase MepM/ murein hydrolase activator NlpD
MKLYIPLFLLMVISYSSFSQSKVRLYSVKSNNKTVLYAENLEVCAVSVVVTLELNNMVSLNGLNTGAYVIPKNTKQFKLTELRALRRGATSHTYKYKKYYGDIFLHNADDDYAYDLPFKKGLSFKISQGYNGKFTHKNENALDFDMPTGTDVLAAREGIVVAVVDTNFGACLTEACKTKANYVLINHSDGTFGNYAHIQYNGAKVTVGAIVNKGDIIASSGNTGFTAGPHLHFICFLPREDGRESLATKFRINNGNNSVYLQQGQYYKRKYN